MLSGITFRFYTDRENPRHLHITRKWGVSIEQAIRAYFDQRAIVVEQPEHQRFETRGARYIVAWLWMDAAQTRVLVITCVDKERL